MIKLFIVVYKLRSLLRYYANELNKGLIVRLKESYKLGEDISYEFLYKGFKKDKPDKKRA